eukprot:4753350-Pleurochrysis_carterae.AAC.1
MLAHSRPLRTQSPRRAPVALRVDPLEHVQVAVDGRVVHRLPALVVARSQRVAPARKSRHAHATPLSA